MCYTFVFHLSFLFILFNVYSFAILISYVDYTELGYLIILEFEHEIVNHLNKFLTKIENR